MSAYNNLRIPLLLAAIAATVLMASCGGGRDAGGEFIGSEVVARSVEPGHYDIRSEITGNEKSADTPGDYRARYLLRPSDGAAWETELCEATFPLTLGVAWSTSEAVHVEVGYEEVKLLRPADRLRITVNDPTGPYTFQYAPLVAPDRNPHIQRYHRLGTITCDARTGEIRAFLPILQNGWLQGPENELSGFAWNQTYDANPDFNQMEAALGVPLPRGEQTIFCARRDASGKAVWCMELRGRGCCGPYITCMIPAANGSVWLVGSGSDPVEIQGITVKPKGGFFKSSLYALRVSRDGKVTKHLTFDNIRSDLDSIASAGSLPNGGLLLVGAGSGRTEIPTCSGPPIAFGTFLGPYICAVALNGEGCPVWGAELIQGGSELWGLHMAAGGVFVIEGRAIRKQPDESFLLAFTVPTQLGETASE